MALFESYERRIGQITPVLAKYGIASLEEAKKLTAFCREHGLIILDCGTLGNNIRTLMPLTITPEQLAKGFRILEDGLKHLAA